MKYLLKNKNKVVLEFEVEKDTKTFEGQTISYVSLKDASIIDKNALPKQISQSDLLSSLESWIRHRKVPQNRQFAENILASIPEDKDYNPFAYIDISFGLSLNDSYWIIPSDKDYKWKDFNLYENEFSEALALSAFGLNLTKVKGFTSSPEYTTNGMLKKCWHRDNGQIYLYKGSTKNDDSIGEAYSEYYMAQIAEVMEFDYVPYDLKLFHNQIVSACPIFTNENEGYMPIHYLLKESPKHYNKLRLMIEVSNIYGKESFGNLMLFDALICNIDRHLGNFGMIVDNNTGEILRPAPIFDNGLSFMATLNKSQFGNISKYLINDISYFDFKFDKQLNLFAEERHIPNLEKLSHFTFKRHKDFNLSEEWLQPIESHIQQRAKMALGFIEEKRQHSAQARPNLNVLIEKIDEAQVEQNTRVEKSLKKTHIQNQESDNIAKEDISKKNFRKRQL